MLVEILLMLVKTPLMLKLLIQFELSYSCVVMSSFNDDVTVLLQRKHVDTRVSTCELFRSCTIMSIVAAAVG